jgi:phospholipid-binding lipoprotein MlaA
MHARARKRQAKSCRARNRFAAACVAPHAAHAVQAAPDRGAVRMSAKKADQMPAQFAPPSRATSRTLSVTALACLTVCLGACANKPPASDPDVLAEYQQTNDPIEPTNRFFYRVNDTLDTYALKPVAQAYIYVVPQPGRTGVHNFLTNLGSPVVFFNDVADAKPRRAGDTFMRFVINSTAGVLGVFDVAKSAGYPGHDAGFGVTLGYWGVPSGPFLYLPVLGPSSPRGVVGYAVDQAADPFTYVPHGYGLRTFNWARFGVSAIDTRSRFIPDLDKVKASALDPYATFRSLYRQNTQSQIDALKADTRSTTPNWYAQ